MLRNMVNQDEYTNRHQFPKNNFFSYRWRVVDHFNRSIDRQMFHLSVHGADNHHCLMNHKVLQLHKSRYAGSRKDLVMDLAQDAIEFLGTRRLQQAKTSKAQVRYCSAMLEQIEHTFNLLISFATELNTILGLSELFITATEPNMDTLDKSKETVLSFAQARFSTSYYSLVVEGKRESINFYLIPADEIISLEDIGLQYESIAKWTANLKDRGQADWLADGFKISDDVHEVFCIQLLSQLIEKTKERLSPKEIEQEEMARFDFVEPDPWIKQTVTLSTQNDTTTATIETPKEVAASQNDEWKIYNREPTNPLDEASGIFDTVSAARVSTVEPQRTNNSRVSVKKSRRKRKKKSRK